MLIAYVPLSMSSSPLPVSLAIFRPRSFDKNMDRTGEACKIRGCLRQAAKRTEHQGASTPASSSS